MAADYLILASTAGDPSDKLLLAAGSGSLLLATSSTGIEYDASANSGYIIADGSFSFNVTIAVGNNRYLVVPITIFEPEVILANPSGPAVTHNGVAMTLLRTATSVTGGMKAQLWGLIAPATGTHAVNVELEASNADAVAAASSFTGVHQTSPVDTSAAATGTSGDATLSITPTADNCWIVDALAAFDASVSVGAGQTQRSNVNGALGSGAHSTEGPKTPAGAVTMSWTGNSLEWVLSAIALRPAEATEPITHSGIIGATIGRVTASVSGTFTKPTYSGTIVATIGKATCSAAATFTKPTFAGRIAVTAGRAAAALSGTFTKPTYTGAIAAAIGRAVASLSGTFTVYTYAGTISAIVGQAVSALVGTFVKPTYSGTIVATVGYASASVVGTFTKPTYTGTIVATAGPVTAALSAAFIKPTFAGTIAGTTGSVTASATATSIKPTYTATILVSVAPIVAVLVGTTAPPTYTGVITATVGYAVAAISATFTKPTYTGSVAVSIGHVVAVSTATYTKPTYTGVITATIGRAVASIAATFTKPIYAGTIVATIAPTIANGSALFLTYIGSIVVTTGVVSASASATFGAGTKSGTISVAIAHAIMQATDILPPRRCCPMWPCEWILVSTGASPPVGIPPYIVCPPSTTHYPCPIGGVLKRTVANAQYHKWECHTSVPAPEGYTGTGVQTDIIIECEMTDEQIAAGKGPCPYLTFHYKVDLYLIEPVEPPGSGDQVTEVCFGPLLMDDRACNCIPTAAETALGVTDPPDPIPIDSVGYNWGSASVSGSSVNAADQSECPCTVTMEAGDRIFAKCYCEAGCPCEGYSKRLLFEWDCAGFDTPVAINLDFYIPGEFPSNMTLPSGFPPDIPIWHGLGTFGGCPIEVQIACFGGFGLDIYWWGIPDMPDGPEEEECFDLFEACITPNRVSGVPFNCRNSPDPDDPMVLTWHYCSSSIPQCPSPDTITSTITVTERA